MKRFVLVLMLSVLLLTGCHKSEPSTVATISPGPSAVTVNNVDDFLAAIAPGAEIELEAGVYDLRTASDYGTKKQNSCYNWVDIGDGFQLSIQGVDNLTIRGREGAEVITQPRYANVLHFQNCTGVTLENFRAGHTYGGACAGGVIYLQNCADAELVHLNLYGCGTTGIRTDHCKDIAVRSCEIFECSSNGIQADNTDGLIVDSSDFHDLGKREWTAGEVFWLQQCTAVSVKNCRITDNRVRNLLNCRPSAGIELRDTDFRGNEIQAAVFSLSGGGLVMENCSFIENEIRAWFDEEGAAVLDGIGKSWDEKMLDTWYNPPEETVAAGERTEIVVGTVDELIAAIAPDTEIVLKDGIYDLSTARDYGTGRSDYYYWAEAFDGPELIICDVDNLMIRSESGDVKKCTVSAVPRYADVLNFKGCSNITVFGFTAGHTVEPGYCTGGVLYFEDSDNVLVNRCGLYGCGILGVRAELCSAVTVTACEIYECSYGGIHMGNVNGVKIEGCSFRDLGGDALYFYDCKDVQVDGSPVGGNSRISY